MKPYSGSCSYGFISYSHKDYSRIKPYVELLQQYGYCLWFDEGIDPGTEWAETIAAKLSGAEIMLLFVSRNSLASHNVKQEIYYANKKNKVIVCLHLEECEMSEGLHLQLDVHQAVFLKKYASIHAATEEVRKALPRQIKKPAQNILLHRQGTTLLRLDLLTPEKMRGLLVRLIRMDVQETTEEVLFSYKWSEALDMDAQVHSVRFRPTGILNKNPEDRLIFGLEYDCSPFDPGTQGGNFHGNDFFEIVDPYGPAPTVRLTECIRQMYRGGEIKSMMDWAVKAYKLRQ